MKNILRKNAVRPPGDFIYQVTLFMFYRTLLTPIVSKISGQPSRSDHNSVNGNFPKIVYASENCGHILSVRS